AVVIVYMCVQPGFGALSDRIGRRNNMILFTALGALAAAPLFFALGQVSSPVTAFLLVLAALIIASFYTSISGVLKAELSRPRCAPWAWGSRTRSPMRSSVARPNTWHCG